MTLLQTRFHGKCNRTEAVKVVAKKNELNYFVGGEFQNDANTIQLKGKH